MHEMDPPLGETAQGVEASGEGSVICQTSP
jgi:hypothetical protein